MSTNREREEVKSVLEEAARVQADLTQMTEELLEAGEKIGERIGAGGRLLIFGNGGSAAQAQHLAAEMVGRFEAERAPIPALELTTDSSILTAVGNDYGFEEIFARQVRGLGRAGDIVLAISTSGDSPNVLRALDVAREMSLPTIALTGRTGGKLRERVDLCLAVPSDSTPRIQEAHLVLGHILCRLIESAVGEARKVKKAKFAREPNP